MNREIAAEVYDIVSQIPQGKVITYGQIAEALGFKSARQVGRILHNNDDPKNVPCHRVVFSDGRLAPAYAFGGLTAQREKLIREGVVFIKDKVDMNTSRWSIDL